MASIRIKLISTDQPTGNVVLEFQKDSGTIYTKTVASLPTNDPTDPVNTFVDAAKKWVVAFYAGQDAVVPQAIAPQVTALVGQSTTVQV